MNLRKLSKPGVCFDWLLLKYWSCCNIVIRFIHCLRYGFWIFVFVFWPLKLLSIFTATQIVFEESVVFLFEFILFWRLIWWWSVWGFFRCLGSVGFLFLRFLSLFWIVFVRLLSGHDFIIWTCFVSNSFNFIIKGLHLFEVSDFIHVGLVLKVLTLLFG